MRTPNGYLEDGTWYTHWDRPIRQATLPERLYARLLARRRRKAWRSLAHTIIRHKAAPVFLLGADMRYSTPGLVISNAARNAATAAGWNATGWNDLWTGALAPGAPDLIIAGIGTNDPTNTAALDALYDKLVATGKPVIMTAPGGLEAGDTARAAMVRHLYSIANRLDLPLIDYGAVIGTAEQATVFGLKRDTLHENERGYVLEARVTVSALV